MRDTYYSYVKHYKMNLRKLNKTKNKIKDCPVMPTFAEDIRYT